MYITASEMYKELCGESGRGCEVAYKIANDSNVDISAELASKNSKSGKKSKKGQEDGEVSKEDMQRKMGRLLMITMMEKCLMENQYCGLLGMSSCAESESSGGDDDKPTEQPTEGQDGSQDEDKICHWKAALDVAVIYDKIMRDNEYLVQLQNQYKAVININSLAHIRAAKSDEQKEGEAIKANLDKSGIGKNLNKEMCQQCVAKNGAEKCVSACSM